MADIETVQAIEMRAEPPSSTIPLEAAPPHQSLRRRLLAGDVAAALFGWGVTLALVEPTRRSLAADLAVLLLAVSATLGALRWQQLYRARVAANRSDEVARIGRATFTVAIAALAAQQVLGVRLDTAVAVLGGGACHIAVAYQRGRFQRWVRVRRAEGLFGRPVLVVGGTAEAMALIDMLNEWPELGFVPVGYAGQRDPELESPSVVWLGAITGITEKVRASGACGVVIAANAIPSIELNRIVRELHAQRIHVHVSSGISGVHHRRMRVQPIGYEPLIYVEPASLSSVQTIVKRLFDVVVAALGLIVTSPVLVGAAIAVKLCDGGPVLFRQERVGYQGTRFTMFKFRSMAVDAEDQLLDLLERNERDGPLFKLTNDPRVTSVGKLLRATSIDELPQLLNVLNGTMSLVGPRPALPREVGQFSDPVARHAVRPGITGLWQVEARDKASFAVYERLDLFYVENWSVWLDLAIILRTGRVVLRETRVASSGARRSAGVAGKGSRQRTAQLKPGRATRPRAGRVLVIVQNMPVPLDRRVWQECQALRSVGCEVSVICPRGDGQGPLQHVDGVWIHTYAPPPATRGVLSYLVEFGYCWLRTLILSVRVRRRQGIDVIQACNPPDTYFLLALLHRPLGTRFVYDQHDLCPEVYESRFGQAGGAAWRGLRWLERMTYRSADHVIVTNESYRAIALSRGKLDPDHVTVVRSGPDPERMVRGDPHPELRAGRRFLCCWLGIMGPQDGVDLLLRSISILVHERGRDDCHFALLGYGDCLADLRAQATALGLDPWITFTGKAEAPLISAYLSTADLGLSADPLSPLNDVSTMNKTMEYMAYGLPVVAYDLIETRVSAAGAARYVAPNEADAYADAIADLLDDPVARAEMGVIGRRRIEQELAWQRQVPGYLAAFEGVLGVSPLVVRRPEPVPSAG